MIAEIILLEDQSQPLPPPFSLDGVTDTSKIYQRSLSVRRRGTSVSVYSTLWRSINQAYEVPTCLRAVGFSLAGCLVVAGLILQLLFSWEIPPGDVGPVIHIKIPPVLSRSGTREIERENGFQWFAL